MVPLEAVVGHLWKSSVQFYQNEKENLRRAEIGVQNVLDSPPEWQASLVQMSNVFRVARAGTEMVLEAYWLSPYYVHAASLGGTPKFRFEPVVQVQLSSPVLVGVLEYLSQHVEEWRRRLGPLVPPFESTDE